ncbi:MAG: DUF6538 domain-containing protein [Rhodospirillaceae bacterium]
MSGNANLLKRSHGVYYFRFYVPSDLMRRFGRRELTYSLATGDRLEARRLSTILRELFFELFAHIRNFDQMDFAPEDLQAMARRFYDRALATAREKRFSSILRSDPGPGPSAAEFRADHHGEMIGTLEDCLKRNDFWQVGQSLDDVMASEGVSFDGGSGEYNHLAHYTLRAVIELQKTLYDWQMGSDERIVSDPFFSDVKAVELTEAISMGNDNGEAVACAAAADSHPSFGQLVALFQAHHERVWKPKTVAKYASCLAFSVELIGTEKPIEDVGKSDIRAVRDTLNKLPRNWRTRYRGLNASEAAQRALSDGVESMTPAAINAYLGALSSLFSWAMKEGYLESNPASQIKVRATVRAEDLRDPFSDAQLNRIFSAPVFRGVRSSLRWRESGPRTIRDERYWVPLIGLYSGMRLGEIFGLLKSDIRTENGIRFFAIREAKTRAGVRRLPIHPILIEAGLMDHVSGLNEGASLFPQSHPAKFSKFFARFLDSLDMTDERLVFHSFRHTFTDALRQARMDEPLAKALIGHSDGSVTGRYGAGYSIETLHDGISAVSYEGLQGIF